ncbi:hypothetical protein F9C11_30610 [Amycolatopsis sp. VS8301801F10]|uniref:hypothetical protein n=1 Tax=Amycolatopsis sp. VS8301801F10 TaxID=2652442 RepID=UPI0038FC0D96
MDNRCRSTRCSLGEGWRQNPGRQSGGTYALLANSVTAAAEPKEWDHVSPVDYETGSTPAGWH